MRGGCSGNTGVLWSSVGGSIPPPASIKKGGKMTESAIVAENVQTLISQLELVNDNLTVNNSFTVCIAAYCFATCIFAFCFMRKK